MRKSGIAVALLLAATTQLLAQQVLNKKGGNFKLTINKAVDKTDVDNQNKTSTCWSFSSLSFFESELLRMGKGRVNLSEMFVVHKAYEAKADIYVRMHGNHSFSPGGAFHDLLNVWKKDGMMPQSAYAGLNYGEAKHSHNEMDEMLSDMVKTVVKAPNGKISTSWKKAFDATLDAYLGAIPQTFEVDGKKYDAQSYAKSLGLNPD